MRKTLFSATGLVKQFHELRATDNVDIDVKPNEVHALIGPNGAGKSTLVNLLSGLLPVDAGRIVLDGRDITSLSAHQRVRAGLSRCFQVTNLFKQSSTLDNLRLAIQAHEGNNFRLFGKRDAEQALTTQAIALGARVGLVGDAVLQAPAGSLPHGAQRQLDIALALAARPKVLLLDEPMAGMGPDESARTVELIRKLRQDMAVLLIEHDMDAVFQLADRISVLVYGKVLATGTVEQIRSNPRVQEVYLGTETA
ncbi:ABC transporter ATP-binding protein [Pusillimonas sp. CC-YST705]|uniref:ABC transporter ATP-binding protein n=1 Tax=Mesopusillimonas faecipullorum TaxID=2755040 RepID=A0ABS8CF95_9BURK|nr:ABC transporter ATP-binding protein [Mesopusillimonas faecipullorum]MCB5364706.1 ABC transporter ATP-binding protein [Mesopusillimonas faecipullorum]